MASQMVLPPWTFICMFVANSAGNFTKSRPNCGQCGFGFPPKDASQKTPADKN